MCPCRGAAEWSGPPAPGALTSPISCVERAGWTGRCWRFLPACGFIQQAPLSTCSVPGPIPGSGDAAVIPVLPPQNLHFWWETHNEQHSRQFQRMKRLGRYLTRMKHGGMGRRTWVGTQGMRKRHLTSVLRTRRNRAGGVRKGALGTDHSRLESELQPTLPFPAGPIGPTEKHSSSGYHIKVPEITSRGIKSPYKELRLRT